MSPGGAESGTPPPVKVLGPAGPEVPKVGGPVPAPIPKECTGAEEGFDTAYMAAVFVISVCGVEAAALLLPTQYFCVGLVLMDCGKAPQEDTKGEVWCL